MSFCFNFSSSSENPSDTGADASNFSENATNEAKCNIVPCEFLSSTVFYFDVDQSLNYKTRKFAAVEVKYIAQESAANQIEKLDICSEKTSDLVPGKYEGGFKVWECSIDLAEYLADNNCIQENDNVLELGCGNGLPGLVAYLYGGRVTFQDYNKDVLKLLAAQNVYLNTAAADRPNILQKCQFLCGDWQDIKEKYYSDEKEKKLYDVIITSETIYERSNHRKLLNLMKAALKPKGVVYLASKVHYFGVGGGVADFERLLKEDGTFDFSTVFKTTEGVERRILKLTPKTS